MPNLELRSYPTYKDSGVAWIGKVPVNWDVSALRHRYSQCLGKMLDSKRNTGSNQLPYLRNTDVQWDRINIDDLPTMEIPRHEYDRYTVQIGDLLVCEGGEVGRCALWSGNLAKCGFQKALHRLRPLNTRHDLARYMYYALSVASNRQAFNDGHLSTIAHLTGEKLRTHPFPFPSFAEQTAIARFLDHAHRRIRRYIRAKKKLIALLEEQKHALIHEAVTGKLDVRTGRPYTTYKDSGVKWLAEVPTHWEVSKLGTMGRFSKGGGGTKQDESEAGVPCIRYGDLYTRHRFFITEIHAYVTSDLASSVYTPIRYGDVLFAGSGETAEEIGKSAVNLMREPVCCGGDVIIFRAYGSIDRRFLGYAADCSASARQKAYMGRGVTVMHIYASDLKHVTIAVPSLTEQASIARFLDQMLADMDAAVDDKRREIELMEEYRTRLVADAVTGVIDVREATAELPKDKEYDDHDPLRGDVPAMPGSRMTSVQSNGR